MKKFSSFWAFVAMLQTIRSQQMIQWDCSSKDAIDQCFGSTDSSDESSVQEVQPRCGATDPTCSFTRITFGEDRTLPVLAFSSTNYVQWYCPVIEKDLSGTCKLEWSYDIQSSRKSTTKLDLSKDLVIDSFGYFNISDNNAIGDQSELDCTWVQCYDYLCLDYQPIGGQINVPKNNSVIIQIQMVNTAGIVDLQGYGDDSYALFFQQAIYMGNFSLQTRGPFINITDNSTMILQFDLSNLPPNGYLSIWGTYGHNETFLLSKNKTLTQYQVVSLIKIVMDENKKKFVPVLIFIGAIIFFVVMLVIMGCLMPIICQQKDQVLAFATLTIEQINSIQKQAEEDYKKFTLENQK